MPLDARGDTASGTRVDDGRLVPYDDLEEEEVQVGEEEAAAGSVGEVREETAKATVPPLARDLTTCLPATNLAPRT